MRILHIITDLNTGGAEKLIVDLLPRLRDNKTDVELCVFNGQKTPLYNEISDTGITVHQFGDKPDYYNPFNILKLIKLARGFDIVHTHNTAPQLFGAIASLFCHNKWITTEHTTTSNRRVWWYRPVERWMYHRYNTVICISEAAAESVACISGNKYPNMTVIPNGINTAIYQSALPVDKLSIGRQNNNKRIILMVGRYSYQKDQSTIIKALSLLDENIELWLAGYGETEIVLENLAKDLNIVDRVHLLGMRSDVPNLLKAADIVVQSSHIEGFGLAAVEAMASGKPVIATDIPGLHEVVSGAGLLFEHENYHQLADHISKLLDDTAMYEELSNKGLERIRLYGVEQMANKYTEIYHSLS